MIVTFINAHLPNLFLFFIRFLHLILLFFNLILVCFLGIVFFFQLFYLIDVLGDYDTLFFRQLARIYVRVIENALVCSLSYFYFISQTFFIFLIFSFLICRIRPKPNNTPLRLKSNITDALKITFMILKESIFHFDLQLIFPFLVFNSLYRFFNFFFGFFNLVTQLQVFSVLFIEYFFFRFILVFNFFSNDTLKRQLFFNLIQFPSESGCGIRELFYFIVDHGQLLLSGHGLLLLLDFALDLL